MKIHGQGLSPEKETDERPQYPYFAFRLDTRCLCLVSGYGATIIQDRDGHYADGDTFVWKEEDRKEREQEFTPLPCGRSIILENSPDALKPLMGMPRRR